MDRIQLRAARASDAEAILGIYRPVVLETAISFEYEPPSLAEMEHRIVEVSARYPWIVACDGDSIVGYAYAAEFRKREAYARTAESTVYVCTTLRGRGIGTQLMNELVRQLRTAGFITLVAGIALPNEGSQALHRSLGFARSGSIPRAGRKFERWYDIEFWTLDLATD